MATTNHTHFLSCDIAGFTFHDGAIVMCDLAIGKKLRLVRESGNIHDPNAIAIWFGDSMLGYIPRSDNEYMAKLIDMGYADIFDARVQRVSPEERPEHQVGVIIYLNRNASDKPEPPKRVSRKVKKSENAKQ